MDLVILNEASPELVHNVLLSDQLLVEHDRAHRVRFETRKRSEYFDVLPVLRLYRRQEPRP
ncbi:MAG: nucleotidyltransferase domain-containing protein [Holophagales bacterium]|nr:nucleotidyltransferase domain-containing protein [Holophagales bacterium]